MPNIHFLCVVIFIISTTIVVADLEWSQKAIVYQIYPRSFKDTNGDGIGDLKGIIEGIEHIKNIGATTIWMSPIYKSPMHDFGYDIADYKAIHPDYGTMEDFENLLKRAKQLGMHVILDFVPNHTSNESVWFDLSVKRTKGYENYYVWVDGKKDPKNPGKLLPPNNWVSVFGGSAWEYNPVRGQFYLHQFSIGQPDLNYRDPRLVEEMKNVLRFWLDKGVSGFRVDAVPYLFEADPKDFGGKLPNEPKTHIFKAGPDDYDYLHHIYTENQDETYDMIYQWRAVLDEYTKKDGIPRLMLTEGYTNIKNVMRYYGDATHNGSIPFNFQFLMEIQKNSDARDIKLVVDKWLTYMPVGKTANWVNGNHDYPRMATRVGIERADIMNMLALILPGIALTYQGEEIAMTNGEVSWEETKDPPACDTNDPINYNIVSRDPERTPFQWDDSKNAGFSTADKPWLPVAKNYKEVNVKAELAAPRSHLKFYKDMADLRRNKVATEGDVELKALSKNVLAVARYIGDRFVIAVTNLGNRDEMVNLERFHRIPSSMTVYTSSIKAKLVKGNKVETSGFMLSPNDAVVLV